MTDPFLNINKRLLILISACAIFYDWRIPPLFPPQMLVLLLQLRKGTNPCRLKQTTKQQTNFIENWKITNYITPEVYHLHPCHRSKINSG